MTGAPIPIVVNGVARSVTGGPDRSLLACLREELGLTGAKYGCGEGVCGACTVLVDGAVTHACLVSVADAAGRSVTTVEGLADDGRLDPVQQAFVDVGAMQCGYCVPGLVVTAVALLRRDPSPDDATIRAALQANVCRCCAYPRILDAVRRASRLPAGAPTTGAGSGTAAAFEDWHPPTPGPLDLTPPDERDYFAALGDGLVAVVPPDPAAGWAASGGAWLHVGADGRVTAFTGKVDVGQGTRGALRVAVARELGTRLDAVRVVMGDTDLCPFDAGTFGSRAMPSALPELRAAAAIARDELRARGALGALGQRVPALEGDRRVVVGSRSVAVQPAAAWTDLGAAGENVRVAAVTGAKRFPTDVAVPGLWYGWVLRGPAPGARLARVDVSSALAVAGVHVVREGDFVGVAGPDSAAARRALEAIEATWHEADLVGEARLVEHLRSHPVEREGWGGAVEHATGEVDGAMARAPVRVEQTYTTAYLAHAPLETRVALAEWRGERVTVWTGTQTPFAVRRDLARALDLDEAQVRVIVPDAGGGFGGKHQPSVAVEAARLARSCGHPVQVRWTREEEFTHAYFRPAAVIDVRVGATSDGDLTALEFTNVNAGAAGISSPYEIPNQRIRFQPAESPLPQGAYRALAATANHFAREVALDELARGLDVDPLDLRLRHLRDERLVAVLEAAARRFGWSERPHEAGYGAGLAGGTEKGGRVATCAEVRAGLGAAPSITRIVTAFECGAIVDADNLRNQVEGATIMALGGALSEAIHFDADRILNPHLAEYRVPRVEAVPAIEVVLLDRPDLPPAGAGETPMVAVAPAISNALFDATGERRRRLPMLERAAPGS